MNNINLWKGDCLELMKNIPDASIDLILTDPPYGTIKGLKQNGNYKDGNNWDVVIDINLMFKEIDRILRPNGRCILFSQDPFTTNLINEIKNIYNLEYNQKAIWLKNNAGNVLSCKKALINYYEDINIISKKDFLIDYENELIIYAQKIKKYTKIKTKDWLNKYNNNNIDHFFRFSKQFNLCTEETYNTLIKDYNINKMEGFKEYNELKVINNNFKSLNKKVFNLNGLKSKSNVFEYKRPNKSLHPTQKPTELLKDLILTYSNQDDLVLDFTMGSGSTGIACIETNRRFIGIELDDNYYKIAEKRINDKLNGIK